MAKITAYKIRHKLTGMYRKSGGDWSKVGKIWTNVGHVKNHLNCDRKYTPGWPVHTKAPLPADAVNWEVVVLEVEESEMKTIPVGELWS